MKHLYSRWAYSMGAVLGWASLVGLVTASQAQTPADIPDGSPPLRADSRADSRADLRADLRADRPSHLGHPTRGTRRGGASRSGTCELAPADDPLTALMPADPEADALTPESVVSLTYRAAPDLWFYMPYALNQIHQVDFVLKDIDDNTLLQSRLRGADETTEPGIIRVSLSDLGMVLEPEMSYHWYLTVHCGDSDTVSVDGWLQQQEIPAFEFPPPETDAEVISIVARYEASQGFWVDSLSTLANGWAVVPDSPLLLETWQELLVSEALDDIAIYPLLDCCQFVALP
ncbi:MAG: DUF928 domain-containing protein [Cyanobacteria bacterium J06648_16]